VFLIFLIPGLYYMQDGYFDTIAAKTNAFFFSCAAAAVFGIYLLYVFIRDHGVKSLLRLPAPSYIIAFFVLSYLLVSIGDVHALDGSAGWSVGAYSYLLGLMIFFIFLIGDTDLNALVILLTVASLPFYFFTVLQGAGLDVFNLHQKLVKKEMYDYISTIGNTTVYSGITSLFLPVVCAALDHVDEWNFKGSAIKALKIIFIVNIAVGGAGIYLVGSDSAYIGMFGSLAVLYIVECKKRTPLWKLGRLAAIISGSFAIAALLQTVNSAEAFPPRKYFSYYICKFHLAYILFPLLLVATLALYKWAGHFTFPWIPISAMIVAAVAVTEVLTPKSRHFGSGRGEIWPFAVNAFKKAGLRQKLFGVGADCFGYLTGSYTNDLSKSDKWYEISKSSLGSIKTKQKVLSVGGREVVNCHNEFLQHLLCGGIVTVGLWSASVISVIIKGLRNKHVSPFLFGFIGWLIQSMLNNPHNTLLSLAFMFAALSIKDQPADE